MFCSSVPVRFDNEFSHEVIEKSIIVAWQCGREKDCTVYIMQMIIELIREEWPWQWSNNDIVDDNRDNIENDDVAYLFSSWRGEEKRCRVVTAPPRTYTQDVEIQTMSAVQKSTPVPMKIRESVEKGRQNRKYFLWTSGLRNVKSINPRCAKMDERRGQMPGSIPARRPTAVSLRQSGSWRAAWREGDKRERQTSRGPPHPAWEASPVWSTNTNGRGGSAQGSARSRGPVRGQRGPRGYGGWAGEALEGEKDGLVTEINSVMLNGAIISLPSRNNFWSLCFRLMMSMFRPIAPSCYPFHIFYVFPEQNAYRNVCASISVARSRNCYPASASKKFGQFWKKFGQWDKNVNSTYTWRVNLKWSWSFSLSLKVCQYY